MEGNVFAEEDPLIKICRYQNQLDQVEAALAINPSHADLLSIKNDLLEIIKILNTQLPPVSDNSLSNVGVHNGDAEREIKTEHEQLPVVRNEARTTATMTSGNNLVQITFGNEESSDNTGNTPGPAPSSSSNTVTPGMEDYLKFRKSRESDKKMFNLLGKYSKKYGIRATDKMPEKLRQFVSELLPSDTQGQLIDIAHWDFRHVPDATLRNRLNRQKKKIKALEINAKRAAQGLPPIFLKKRNKWNNSSANFQVSSPTSSSK